MGYPSAVDIMALVAEVWVIAKDFAIQFNIDSDSVIGHNQSSLSGITARRGDGW